ncbi:uncharacterized protein LOC108672048 [Hyalella azteca]|uniref:Uncharacterized protein LOC108672048 n=1 Tax=Hyalella azteca TaxID=294128 RepID=A0A979FSY2_HYAAZ|nr:uncharacterized protein LOC108672048 [Hyalella azteca]
MSMFERWFLYRSMEVTASPGHWVFGNQNSTDRRPILQNSMNEEAETSGTSIIREEPNSSPSNVKLQAYRHFNIVGTKSLVERPVTISGYDLKESMIDHPDGRFMSCGQNSHMLTFKPNAGRDRFNFIRTKSFVYPGYGNRVPQGHEHEIVAIATHPTMGRHISILGRSDIVEDRTEQPPRFGLHCSHAIAFSPICSGGALSPATDPDDTTWASSSLEASPMGETVV